MLSLGDLQEFLTFDIRIGPPFTADLPRAQERAYAFVGKGVPHPEDQLLPRKVELNFKLVAGFIHLTAT